jgi:hypothetical protein
VVALEEVWYMVCFSIDPGHQSDRHESTSVTHRSGVTGDAYAARPGPEGNPCRLTTSPFQTKKGPSNKDLLAS